MTFQFHLTLTLYLRDSLNPHYGHPHNTGNSLLIITGVQASGVIIGRLLRQCCFVWITHYYVRFASSLGKESLYIFSKFNSLNTDTPLIQDYIPLQNRSNSLVYIIYFTNFQSGNDKDACIKAGSLYTLCFLAL